MEDKVPVGEIEYGYGDHQVFYEPQAYIQAVKDALNELGGAGGFRQKTLTQDPAIHRAVDDLIFRMCCVDEEDLEL